MRDNIKHNAKKNETRRGNFISRKPKKRFSQSKNSPVDQVLHLQKTIGNRAVTRLIQLGAIQANLTIGKPNDIYEKEADSVADRVMSMPEGSLVNSHLSLGRKTDEYAQTKPLAEQITPLIQRQAEEEEEVQPKLQRQAKEEEEEPVQAKLLQRQEAEEEEPVQAKLLQRQESEEEKVAQAKLQRQAVEEEEEPVQAKLIQRQGAEEEEEPVQTKLLQPQESEEEEEAQTKLQRQAEEEEEIAQTKAAPNNTPEVTPNIESNINSMKGGGQPLSESTRSFFEPRFGADFSQVRVHNDNNAAQTAQSINAKAFTTGKDIVFNSGQYSPGTSSGKRLLAHELTHVVQQKDGKQPVQRDNGEGTPQTSNAEAEQRFFSARNRLLESGPYFDPNSREFIEYGDAYNEFIFLGESHPEEPQGVFVPPNQLIVVDEAGQVLLVQDEGMVGIDEELFSVQNNLGRASQGETLSGVPGGELGQVLLWNDGRAVITPPTIAELPELLIMGEPAELESAFEITVWDPQWERLRDASIHGVFTSGIYQLGTSPISRFNGVNLPPGSRIRFADPFFQGAETRMVTIFQPGTRQYYAWDCHLPVGNKPHDLWHVNQRGMYGLFGQSNHSPMSPPQIAQGRALRYIKIGGRVFLVVGIIVDSYTLTSSLVESVERGTPRPTIAEAVRVVGGWGGAWLGVKVGCSVGGLAGIETGPGAVLTCLAGGLIGGIAGFFGADWIADMIEE